MKPSLVQATLNQHLEPLVMAERKLLMTRAMALLTLTLLAVVTILVFVAAWLKWTQTFYSAIWLTLLVLPTLVVWLIVHSWKIDLRVLARKVESANPNSQAALLAAIEQKPASDGTFSYLQERVFNDVLKHARENDWINRCFTPAIKRWQRLESLATVGILVVTLFGSYYPGTSYQEADAPKIVVKTAPIGAIEIKVTPGDAEVERGGRLVIEAKFPARVPSDAVIILEDPETLAERGRFPMKPTVDDHVFGGLVSNIDKDATYRIEFASEKSDGYKITTFVHPELVQTDAKITPPAYTKLPAKETKNTMTVSVMEGSEIGLRLTVNKPIAQAELYGEDKTSIPLKPSADNPLVLEAAMVPDKSQKYRVHLVDDHERANKQPPSIKIAVQKNMPPKIEVVFPKRDLAVSPIQELPIEAKVWDDVGVQRVGAMFTLAGQNREVLLSKDALAGGKHHELKTVLELEKMKAQPKQLVSYYLWAEDIAADGKTRRSLSDMFFAEVRHFEDIFREKEAPPSEPAEPGDEDKGQVGELVKLQKDVVNANWRLIRDTGIGKTFAAVETDIGVVKTGEDTAKEKTEAMLAKVKDAEIGAALKEASKLMGSASAQLEKTVADKTNNGLDPAMGMERSALEELYKAMSREHAVMRAKPSQSKGGKPKPPPDQQVMQLELKQKDQRYEEAKEAKEEQTKEQQENLQVLNRLKELARRQEALAQKIKELETQLQQAKGEQEKKELERQLKHLQEEQEQLLRDLDEVKERMEKPENQANMAEEREKLDAAREKARDAAEKLKDNQLNTAANAATRAQRDLEEARDDFRKRTSKRFGDEMKQLKQQAGDLAQNQEKLAEALQKNGTTPSNPNNEANENAMKRALAGAQAARQMEEQKAGLEKLLDEMKRVSEAAEGSEPLLSSALYDSVRKAQSTGVDKALDDARDHARYGDVKMAQEHERKASQGIDDLKKGVDKAAESVLGSETDALRMARAELDRLMKDVNDADKAGEKGKAQTADAKAKEGAKRGDAEKPRENDGKAPGQTASKDGEKSAGGEESKKDAMADAKGKGDKAGQDKGDGKAPGKKAGDPKMAEAGGEPSPDGKGEKGEQGKGDGKGPGKEGGDPKMADAKGKPSPDGKGDQPGQGEGNGDGQGKPGEDGQQPAQGEGQGQGPGKGAPNVASANGEPKPGVEGKGGKGNGQPNSEKGGKASAQANAGSAGGAGGNGGGNGGWFFDEAAATQAPANDPVTGDNFGEWTDRLRRVQEMLDTPQLSGDAARILDNARDMRVDYKRNPLPPQAAVVQARITQPLAELRDRVMEELAKRESKDSLTPLDRDPVPNRYRELVRRYYTELGTGR